MPTLRINDIDLYYEATGQGQPILFVHGLGSSTRDWQRQVAYFSPHYRAVTFDLRGHGQSHKPPGPYTIPLFASDSARLIESLDLAPAHVVGISLGGMVAFQLAVDRPELLRSLVIINSSPELVLRTLKERWQAFQRLLIVRLLGMRKMGQVLGQRLFPRAEHADLRRLFVERWAENDARAYLASFRAVLGWSVTDRLPELRIPTLVVAADQDYTPVAVKEAYVARMPQAELVVIEDSRHATPVEQPERLNQAIMAFLSRQG
jgi:pimeloyl-ACP methyl ester carboxylesterase